MTGIILTLDHNATRRTAISNEHSFAGTWEAGAHLDTLTRSVGVADRYRAKKYNPCWTILNSGAEHLVPSAYHCTTPEPDVTMLPAAAVSR